MEVLQDWLPPSRENWELIVWAFKFFPLITVGQWFTDFHPAGKNSVESRFNIPGKIAWATMEIPGFIVLLYTMFTLPEKVGLSTLPWPNWVMGTLYTVHYIYRSLLCPLLNPSMSPIHLYIWSSAFVWQVVNGVSIGGWLGGWGPRTLDDWEGHLPWIAGGMIMFSFGLLSNFWHDDELREIRRAAARKQKRKAEAASKTGDAGLGEQNVDKVYEIPENGLFRFVFYPHYLSEWFEWTGFWMIGGLRCLPAQSFVLNEVSAMLPQAMQGKRWYLAKFGPAKVGNRKAVIPGLL
ncbi:MAG: hypothetical protein M1837_000881 [Sclerophora amabilis]|nr:MAG: hypothetical protein M1837_000881 [Sclerophora amabilis]